MPDTPSQNRFIVIARDGLKLRSGPSIDFSIVRTIPEGTIVNVLSRQDMWALVDLEGDGRADGFMNLPFSGRSMRQAPRRRSATLPASSHRRW